MQEMKEKGIEAQLYRHAIGNHGHGLGLSFGQTSGPGREPGEAVAQRFLHFHRTQHADPCS
jgi:hypothetical protein